MKTPGGIVYLKLKLNNFIYVILLLIGDISKSGAEDVKFVFSKEKKLETVFLFPGRVSLFNLPCSVTKALIGSPNDIKVEVDKLNPKDTHVLLKKWRAQPSNLILKCNETVFLFNLIPSKSSHSDYVRVLSHIESKPLKIKSPSPNTPSSVNGGLRGERDFIIRKILDFSWRNE